ncbi:MAG TPA: hypothetical protein VFT50_18610 [Baekduia sp.]|nr:hypothetical protein [Baekduia sp.]
MAEQSIHLAVPRCARCGDVIGVYEPAVLLVEGEPHATSIAAEAPARHRDGAWLHRGCFAPAAAAATG